MSRTHYGGCEDLLHSGAHYWVRPHHLNNQLNKFAVKLRIDSETIRDNFNVFSILNEPVKLICGASLNKWQLVETG
jgi:hypothetical protein